jgi:hypothetical protein
MDYLISILPVGLLTSVCHEIIFLSLIEGSSLSSSAGAGIHERAFQMGRDSVLQS